MPVVPPFVNPIGFNCSINLSYFYHQHYFKVTFTLFLLGTILSVGGGVREIGDGQTYDLRKYR